MTQGTAHPSGCGLSGPEELRNNGVVKNVGVAREASAEAPQEELATGERSTRNRVARSILDHGPSTATELAGRLGLTQAAVRRHLDALVADDVVEAREQRVYGARTRGRPAKVFALTERGREGFVQQYDDLAAQALRFLRDTGGEEAVKAFAHQRVAFIQERFGEVAVTRPELSPVEVLATVLTNEGYAAAVRTLPLAGEQLCQQHCPVSHVAHEFPQLCEAETEAIGKVLGRHVQRLATIAHGDGVCTTCIPATPTSDIGKKEKVS